MMDKTLNGIKSISYVVTSTWIFIVLMTLSATNPYFLIGTFFYVLYTANDVSNNKPCELDNCLELLDRIVIGGTLIFAFWPAYLISYVLDHKTEIFERLNKLQ